MGKPILGYWDLRGLAEPIRFLLHYKKVDFEDKRYAFDTDGWQKDKFNLGLDFPNLPYYIDGDTKLTQSTAILRYVARKYGLDGKDDDQKLRVSIAEQQIVDLRWGLILLVIRSDYNDNAKAEFVKKIPDMLKLWENFIGDQKYLTGDDITYVDFMAYDTFDFYRLFHAEALDEFPKLRAFQNRIKSLPELQEYLSSSTYKKWPIFGPMAKFGGGGDPPKHL
ncbi:glutathione S-transferase Mu 1-like [Argiope bruennichi]|uniref:glutathione transferase n=1 Tax=Argiope bruennichi TaxID=94029 RepID=A0A8T0EQC3_ARGBR|nr:glutathione S-transferase Mu 1-like [Argiope bruennichi]KAF8777980.1 Glutathione S-transferase Mu 1 like protein [Argiope bruennichi]